MEEIKIPKNSNEKVNSWLKDQIPENKIARKPNSLKNETGTSKDKIEEVKNQLLEKYPPDEIENTIAPIPQAQESAPVVEKKKKAPLKDFLNKYKKKLFTTLGLLVVTAPAVGQNKDINKAADQAFSNTKAMYANAVKVDKVPEGYSPAGTTKDGKKYFIQTNTKEKSNLEIAKSDGPKGDNSKFLIEQLQNGVSPEELVKTGHASPSGIKKYIEFYQPSVDVVYIEPGQKSKEIDPYAKFAIKGEGIYLPGVGGHNAGQIYYLSMKSKNAYEAGMTNTANEPFIVRLENGNGKYIDTTVMLKSIEHRNKFFDISGRHLLPGAYEELKKLAEEQMKSNTEGQSEQQQDKDIKQLNPDFTVKANKVGFSESELNNNK